MASKVQGYACGPKLYGCMFPGSPCCTRTETNGNIHRQVCLGHLDPITILNVQQFFHFIIILISTVLCSLQIIQHVFPDMLAILERAVWSFLQYFTQGQLIIIISFDNGNGQRTSFGPQNYMGACSQAPRAAPRQRQMGMHHVSLIILLYFRMLP